VRVPAVEVGVRMISQAASTVISQAARTVMIGDSRQLRVLRLLHRAAAQGVLEHDPGVEDWRVQLHWHPGLAS